MSRQRKVVITMTYNDLGIIVDTKTEELDLSAQPNLQLTCNQLATDLISRQAAIDELYKMLHDCFWADDEELDAVITTLNDLPSVQPEIVHCKDCRKHNVHSGYKDDCCALYEWRGMSYGHEHDYQFCCFAERRAEEQ